MFIYSTRDNQANYITDHNFYYFFLHRELTIDRVWQF